MASAYDSRCPEVIFDRLFQRAAALLATSVQVSCVAFDAMKSEFPTEQQLESLDALVITGSKHSAYDNEPKWIPELRDWISQLHASQSTRTRPIKILGICFGHQILAEALGGVGTVSRSPLGWEVGHTTVTLNEKGLAALKSDRESVV